MRLKNNIITSILTIGMVLTSVLWPSSAFAADDILDIVNQLEAQFSPNSVGDSTRLAGSDRYQTAVKISQQGWAYHSSEFAILSAGTDDNLVDALTAAPLAYLKNAPILLTEGDRLNLQTEAELMRLGVKTVYVTSGIGLIRQSVIDKLQNEMKLTVVTLGGKNRFETSINIAKELGNVTKVAISTAFSNADALSMASIAAANGMPILLSEVNNLPIDVTKYLASLDIQQSFVLGGEGVISKSVEKALPNPTRLGGANRYETNSKIIHAFRSDLKPDKVYLASGNDANIVDALSGSSLAAKTLSAVVLVDKLGLDKSTEYLVKGMMFPTRMKNLVVLGGESVVPQTIVNDLGTIVEYVQDGITVSGTDEQPIQKNNSIAVLGNNITLDNVHTPYELYVQGNNVALRNLDVGESLILNPGASGKVSLENVTAETVVVLSGSIADSLTIKNSQIGLLIIQGISNVGVSANFNSQISATVVLTYATLKATIYEGDINEGPGGFGMIIVGQQGQYAPELKLQGDFSRYGTALVAVNGKVINTEVYYPVMVSVQPDNKNNSVTLQGLFSNVYIGKPGNFTLLGSNSTIDSLTIASSDVNLQLDGLVKEIDYKEE